jgi:hypothetical protein
MPGTAVFDHTTQQIAAVSRAPGNLDLFVIGFDNHVWITYWNEQTGWDRDPNGQVNPNGHFFPLPGTACYAEMAISAELPRTHRSVSGATDRWVRPNALI